MTCIWTFLGPLFVCSSLDRVVLWTEGQYDQVSQPGPLPAVLVSRMD